MTMKSKYASQIDIIFFSLNNIQIDIFFSSQNNILKNEIIGILKILL